MKKTYIAPSIESMETCAEDTLLTASAQQPTTLFDSETADGNESLSRRHRNVWDDEEEEEDF